MQQMRDPNETGYSQLISRDERKIKSRPLPKEVKKLATVTSCFNIWNKIQQKGCEHNVTNRHASIGFEFSVLRYIV